MMGVRVSPRRPALDAVLPCSKGCVYVRGCVCVGAMYEHDMIKNQTSQLTAAGILAGLMLCIHTQACLPTLNEHARLMHNRDQFVQLQMHTIADMLLQQHAPFSVNRFSPSLSSYLARPSPSLSLSRSLSLSLSLPFSPFPPLSPSLPRCAPLPSYQLAVERDKQGLRVEGRMGTKNTPPHMHSNGMMIAIESQQMQTRVNSVCAVCGVCVYLCVCVCVSGSYGHMPCV